MRSFLRHSTLAGALLQRGSAWELVYGGRRWVGGERGASVAGTANISLVAARLDGSMARHRRAAPRRAAAPFAAAAPRHFDCPRHRPRAPRYSPSVSRAAAQRRGRPLRPPPLVVTGSA
jgi:hypothetical protein